MTLVTGRNPSMVHLRVAEFSAVLYWQGGKTGVRPGMTHFAGLAGRNVARRRTDNRNRTATAHERTHFQART